MQIQASTIIFQRSYKELEVEDHDIEKNNKRYKKYKNKKESSFVYLLNIKRLVSGVVSYLL